MARRNYIPTQNAQDLRIALIEKLEGEIADKEAAIKVAQAELPPLKREIAFLKKMVDEYTVEEDTVETPPPPELEDEEKGGESDATL